MANKTPDSPARAAGPVRAGSTPATGPGSRRTAPTPALRAARARRGHAARRLGAEAELIAARFLASQGLRILHRNFRRRRGELDLVAIEGKELVVVEVRSRSTSAFGGAIASIDSRKRQRIVLATQLLLQQYKDLGRMRVRFDVVSISDVFSQDPRVEWIRSAFAAN